MNLHKKKWLIFSFTWLLILGITGTVFAADLGDRKITAKAVSSSKIEITWSMNEQASGYTISRGTSINGGYQKLDTVSGTTTSYRDKTVKPAKTYYYKVTPISAAGGEVMPDAELTVKGKTPQQVQISKISVKSETKMKLYWNSCSGANGYEVYRSNSSDGEYKLLAKINGKETNSYTDSKAVPGKTYYYKLKSTNVVNGTEGYSSYSQAVKGKTIAKTKITSITSSNSTTMKISWKKVSGATSYDIYRSTNSTNGFKKITTVKGSSKSYTDKKVTAGKKYYYKILTIGKLNGKKINSGYTSAVSNRALKQVKISSVKTTTDDGLKIKWSKVTGASKYKVYRASSSNGSYKKIASIKATGDSTQSYTDKSITVGKTYYYKVQAYSADNGVISAGSGNKSEAKSASTLYAIMGKSTVTAEQMANLFKSTGRSFPSSIYKDKGAKNIEQFCEIVLDESEKEGVRAEVIFAQICLETGYLSFRGQVRAEQCNFSGLGATDDGASGATFPNVRTGIRAQVQHLKGYASKDPLNQVCVDPRFIYLASRRGTTKYVQNLGNGNWATDPNYATKLMNLIKAMKK